MLEWITASGTRFRFGTGCCLAYGGFFITVPVSCEVLKSTPQVSHKAWGPKEPKELGILGLLFALGAQICMGFAGAGSITRPSSPIPSLPYLRRALRWVGFEMRASALCSCGAPAVYGCSYAGVMLQDKLCQRPKSDPGSLSESVGRGTEETREHLDTNGRKDAAYIFDEENAIFSSSSSKC